MNDLGIPSDFPWFVDGPQIRDANGYALASVPHSLGDGSDKANAQLMAAAPDLLDAVILLMGAAKSRYTLESMRYEGIIGKAENAIAKAVISKGGRQNVDNP